ncbi:BAG domain protein [Drechmeria coniospora]|uniref:BAG domain protein n=1 Tax=Drechmeria coniospora TaxID=98403 RepID=A0A151GJB1_DRECN|nr:BAG domain protein [Drechmeria coniospora]KYK57169.1 BAG domain protein [Drechmeria coniospora]
MSRYGWSLNREQSSPYGSVSGRMPAVTDDDFSYITSRDLDAGERHYPRRRSTPEDDILILKNKGATYPANFPAYSIGDGKLRVNDVRDRIGLLMGLSDRATRRIKLLYKGKQLKEPAAAVRDYGVKNRSELMAVLPEAAPDDAVIADVSPDDAKSRRRKKKKSGKKRDSKGEGDSASSPCDAPRAGSSSGPMKRIEELHDEFVAKWLPLCTQYTASPPSDPKTRDEEHRRLSESILQSILLKLDGVDTEGIPEVRARRKELVNQVQGVLKALDAAKAS